MLDRHVPGTHARPTRPRIFPRQESSSAPLEEKPSSAGSTILTNSEAAPSNTPSQVPEPTASLELTESDEPASTSARDQSTREGPSFTPETKITRRTKSKSRTPAPEPTPSSTDAIIESIPPISSVEDMITTVNALAPEETPTFPPDAPVVSEGVLTIVVASGSPSPKSDPWEASESGTAVSGSTIRWAPKSQNGEKSRISPGTVAGIVLGVIFALILAVILVLRRRSFVRRRNRKRAWAARSTATATQRKPPVTPPVLRLRGSPLALGSDGNDAPSSPTSSFGTNLDCGTSPYITQPGMVEVQRMEGGTGSADPLLRQKTWKRPESPELSVDCDSEYLALPRLDLNAPTHLVNGQLTPQASPMSVRPFSPTESFAFPRPPGARGSFSSAAGKGMAGVGIQTSVWNKQPLTPPATAVIAPASKLRVLTPRSPPLGTQDMNVPPAAHSTPTKNPIAATFFPEEDENTLVSPPVTGMSIHLDDPEAIRFPDVETIRRPFLPSLDDELGVGVGDCVRVVRVFDDGWAYVRLVSSVEGKARGPGAFKKGLIPIDCLRDAGQDLPAFLAAKRLSSYADRSIDMMGVAV